MQLTLDISNTRYLELFGISNKYLGPLANNYSVSQTLDISNSFLIPPESSRYREATV